MSRERRKGLLAAAVFLAFIFALPLVGVWLGGEGPIEYLDFPPAVKRVWTPPPEGLWTWIVLLSSLSLFLLCVLGFASYRRVGRECGAPTSMREVRFPLWGYGAVIYTLAMWILAWNRFPWFSTFQPHTFAPLWLGYIFTVNALVVWRKGRSLITEDVPFFISLFPASAIFWWTFEYLNRFAQNWHYVGLNPETAWQYILFASISFSTVLPAVYGTSELMFTFLNERKVRRFDRKISTYVSEPSPRFIVLSLAVSFISMVGIGLFPDYFYPFLWISPLLLLTSLALLLRLEMIMAAFSSGGVKLILSYSLGALVCGFFWEMWNLKSLAKWKYTVPFVPGAKLFEMPLPGYAGYLPFGMECLLAILLVKSIVRGGSE